MRRGRGFVKRINRHRPERAEFYGHRLLERRAALWLCDSMSEWSPWQGNAGAFGLGGAGWRLRAANRGNAAFAACDPLRRLMQIADRALAADRAVIGMFWLDAETHRELLFRIAVAPAEKIDDVERADIAEQFAPGVLLGALERFFDQGEGLEAGTDFFRAVDDFAHSNNDGNAVVGDGGVFVRHFLVFTF